MRRTILIALVAALVAAVPAGARQADGTWATVNVCDTMDHPNEIGIRGSMRGLKRKARMTMRFRVQYNDDGVWRLVRRGADSGHRDVAVARRGRHDAGWSFEFAPPESGPAIELRGLVIFAWRRGGEIVRRERHTTTAGHPGTVGADPPGYSAESCYIA
jgi:hypothetical protein